MKNCFILLFVLLFGAKSWSQSSRIESFQLQASSNNQVLVRWVVGPGSTCNAPQVQHSLDGENFTTVYTYPGVCGGTDEAESYSWVHANAKPYSFNYYRVKLDEGEFTLTKQLDLNSNLANTNFLVYPNPTKGEVTLEWRNEARLTYDLLLINAESVKILEIKSITTNQKKVHLPNLKAGVYYFILIQAGEISQFRQIVIY
ncbi:MAG: T9SS type A sorting domain-containing protein [Vicingaceae bacterium]